MTISVLTNRHAVTTPPFSGVATPLRQACAGGGLSSFLCGKAGLDSFASGFLMYLKSSGYSAAHTIGHRPTVGFALGSLLFGKRKARHVAGELFYDIRENGGGIAQRLYLLALRRLFREVDGVIVTSTAESREYSKHFSVAPDRFRFIAWPSNIDPVAAPVPGDGSVFSAGRSLRDWETLAAVARRMPNLRFVVVASGGAARHFAGIGNVTFHADIPYAQYKALLHHASIVVVPLRDTTRSSGQAAFLEAMALGKPTIVTRTAGSVDYVTHGENGLLHEPYDQADLEAQVRLATTDAALRERLAEAALQSVKERFNRWEYSRELHDAMRDIVRGGE